MNNLIVTPDERLQQIKIEFQLLNVMKYFLIHSYPAELRYLDTTLNTLRNKYATIDYHHVSFIDDLTSTFYNKSNDTNDKIDKLMYLIRQKQNYELYSEIVRTLPI